MIERKTTFSADRVYRYTLWREFGGELFWAGVNRQKHGFVQFIGLNPSTADELVNDATIRVCQGFACRWGYAAMCMTNLFAFRATDPDVMMRAVGPVGVENDMWLERVAGEAALVVAAWGTRGSYLRRDAWALKNIRGLHHIGLTAKGYPRHPLRIKASTQPKPL